MRNARDPRRLRSQVQLILEGEVARDANGDPIGTPEIEIIWEGRANVQPWLPRYNIPTAPVTGGVQERRIAARAYLPFDAPVNVPGVKLRDLSKNVVYDLITKGLNQAGANGTWRCDLGAPRISAGHG